MYTLLSVKSDTTPPDFANPRFTDDGDIDANWTERNHEARRGAKFQLTIVDFARGPTLTKVTVASQAKLNYVACLMVTAASVFVVGTTFCGRFVFSIQCDGSCLSCVHA